MMNNTYSEIGNNASEWKKTQLKRVLNSIKDGTHGTYERTSAGYPLLSAKNVFDNGIKTGENESYISEDDYQSIISNGYPRKGDVLMSIVGTVGRTCVYEQDVPMAFQRSVAFLRCNERMSPYYLKYYLQSPHILEEEKLSSNGTAQVGLYLGAIEKLPILIPSIFEQDAIAAYLDEKCGTIDEIIAEAKASIEEYKMWKSSVIFEAVTKGLDPNTEMKDSGVEWIGKVPQHWRMSTIKKHFAITLGKMLANEKRYTDDSLESYICAANIKWSGIDTQIQRQMWFSSEEKNEYLLRQNDLLVMEGGSAGTATIYNNEFSPCYIQNSVNRCRGKNGNLTKFLYYWMFLTYYSGHIERICNKATIMHLTKEKLGNLPLVVIPIAEQEAIVAFLDEKCAAIDGIIAQKEALIADMEAYKKSLIFETVTGKRKVC